MVMFSSLRGLQNEKLPLIMMCILKPSDGFNASLPSGFCSGSPTFCLGKFGIVAPEYIMWSWNYCIKICKSHPLHFRNLRVPPLLLKSSLDLRDLLASRGLYLWESDFQQKMPLRLSLRDLPWTGWSEVLIFVRGPLLFPPWYARGLLGCHRCCW